MPRYVILGNESDPFAEKCENLLKRIGPYRTQRSAGKIAFGLTYESQRALSLLQVSDWMNSTTIHGFTLGAYADSPGLREIDRFKIGSKDIETLPALMADQTGYRRFERLNRIVFYSSLQQLPEVLANSISPLFFDWYPSGRVISTWGAPELHTGLAALRVMGAGMDLADRDYEELEKIVSFSMIADAQNSGVFYSGKHLSIPIAMFLPRLYGFVASKVTLGFLFLLDSPIDDVREFYPRSGLEFVRSEASGLFRQSLSLDIDQITHDSIDQFALIHRDDFTVDDFRSFIRQYLRKLSSLLSFVINPSNFATEQSGEWVGLAHYRAWLSIQRIADEMLFMLTEDTPYLRKAACFRILDQLASLYTEEERLQADAFKLILLPREGVDLIMDGLSKYRGAIALHLRELLEATRREIVDVALDSIYVPGILDRLNNIVTLPDGDTISGEDYAAELVRELRNTQHSYYTRNFDRYLAFSTGNTPESLPLIAALAFLALLAKPELFIGREW